jgi:hypothetical protein
MARHAEICRDGVDRLWAARETAHRWPDLMVAFFTNQNPKMPDDTGDTIRYVCGNFPDQSLQALLERIPRGDDRNGPSAAA